jgi:hypothetical protein
MYARCCLSKKKLISLVVTNAVDEWPRYVSKILISWVYYVWILCLAHHTDYPSSSPITKL